MFFFLLNFEKVYFIIADTVGIFVLCGWELSILETIIIIIILRNNFYQNKCLSIEKDREKPSIFARFRTYHRKGNAQRFRRIESSLIRVGFAVFIASFTSFLAGLSIAPSKLTSFSQMGFFLMLIMCVSWLQATWFFLPLLLFIGSTDKFGDIAQEILFECSFGLIVFFAQIWQIILAW